MFLNEEKLLSGKTTNNLSNTNISDGIQYNHILVADKHLQKDGEKRQIKNNNSSKIE